MITHILFAVQSAIIQVQISLLFFGVTLSWGWKCTDVLREGAFRMGSSRTSHCAWCEEQKSGRAAQQPTAIQQIHYRVHRSPSLGRVM
jgi:hypothetical protein